MVYLFTGVFSVIFIKFCTLAMYNIMNATVMLFEVHKYKLTFAIQICLHEYMPVQRKYHDLPAWGGGGGIDI